MSQAQTLSRRTMLAGASTIAAFTTIAAAEVQPNGGTSTSDADHPDAELLAIGARFEPLYAAWCQQMAADNLERFQLEVAIEQATDTKRAGLENDENGEWTPEKTAYYQARGKFLKTIPRDQARDKTAIDEFNALTDALDELGADLLAFNAETHEGLALQAKAMVVNSFENIEPSFEWDGAAPDDWLRCLLQSLCAYAGVQFPPYRSHVDMLIEREG